MASFARAGDLLDTKRYFGALQASSGDGAQSTRPEPMYAKSLQ